jgi:hypothetical protein
MATHNKEPKRDILDFAALRVNPRNANVVPQKIMAKLERNIKRTGLYPPLIVRPLGNGTYMILDGHHRKRVLENLGHTSAICEVWPVDEREADILLATLNSLHGKDDKELRRALIESLTESYPVEDLADMLPETEAALHKLIDPAPALPDDSKNEPQNITFYLYPDQYVAVKNALEHIKTREELHKGKNADGMALYYMAVEYSSGVERDLEEEKNAPPPIGGGGVA